MSNDEIQFLSEYYVDDAKNIENNMLTTYEKELLESYRALDSYMKSTYIDVSYHVTGVLPAESSGTNYDMFCVSINGGKEYVFRTQRDDSGKYEVIYDEYSHT